MKLLGEIVEKDDMICLQTGPSVWFPLDGASGIASDFRETFNQAQCGDIGRRLYRVNGSLCMESVNQARERKAKS